MAKATQRSSRQRQVPLPRSPQPDDVGRLLALLPERDLVELKVTVPDTDRRPVLTALGVDPLDAEIRQIGYVDTRDLALHAAGLSLRVRRTQHRAGDVIVRLRAVGPESLSAALREQHGFGVELDITPRGFVCSAILGAEVTDRRARELLSRRFDLLDVLSGPQRALLEENLPGDVVPSDLVVHGPIHVLKRKFLPSGFEHRLVAELGFLPDGARIFELSTRCTPSTAVQVAAETKRFLAAHGVDLDARPETHTRSALRSLAAGTVRP